MSERDPRTRSAPPGNREDYVLLAMPSPGRAAAHQSVLAELGLATTVTRDGEEARRELSRHAPTLIVLDLSLPKVDGFALLRELRANISPDRTAAIVVSGHAAILEAARRMAEALGIVRVLPLDADRAVLREAIETALRGRAAAVFPRRVPAAEKRKEPVLRADQLVDGAVLSAAQRFRTAITLAYVKLGSQEIVRGTFAVTDPTGPINVAPTLGFLRQVAAGTDPLIVPDVQTYAAVGDFAPGLALARGFAAAPINATRGELAGALCVIDAQPLQLDAEDLHGLEALARDLGRDLAGIREIPAEAPAEGAPRTPTAADIDSLERLASADPLTGLSNRRGGEKDIAAEISRARRQTTALSCVLIDLDHFKQVNDTYGHQAGDYVLREIGALLRRTLRAYDILIRWGGEEFLVVLPGVAKEQAFMLGERERSAIEGLRLAGIPGVTASVGVASLASDYSFEAMFAAADRQLYRVKASGRNSVA